MLQEESSILQFAGNMRHSSYPETKAFKIIKFCNSDIIHSILEVDITKL